VGEPMLGLFDTAHWSYDLENEANRRFVAEFQKEYKRIPSVFAAQGYDTALLIDSAVRRVKGNLDNKDALRAAFKAADFKSVRGPFKFNRNQYPVQDLPPGRIEGRRRADRQQEDRHGVHQSRRCVRAGMRHEVTRHC
jgi:branched-chain amino acid transport system substrate-binding protein